MEKQAADYSFEEYCTFIKEFAPCMDDYLYFYDAAAPIVSAESIDMECAFAQSRYDRGGDADYINCPMNKEEYEAFYE